MWTYRNNSFGNLTNSHILVQCMWKNFLTTLTVSPVYRLPKYRHCSYFIFNIRGAKTKQSKTKKTMFAKLLMKTMLPYGLCLLYYCLNLLCLQCVQGAVCVSHIVGSRNTVCHIFASLSRTKSCKVDSLWYVWSTFWVRSLQNTTTTTATTTTTTTTTTINNNNNHQQPKMHPCWTHFAWTDCCQQRHRPTLLNLPVNLHAQAIHLLLLMSSCCFHF